MTTCACLLCCIVLVLFVKYTFGGDHAVNGVCRIRGKLNDHFQAREVRPHADLSAKFQGIVLLVVELAHVSHPARPSSGVQDLTT